MKTAILLGLTLGTMTLATVTMGAERTRTKKTVVVRRNAVSTTHTTAATYDPYYRRDVVESRADERRLYEGRHWTLAPMVGAGTNGLGLGVGGRFGYTFATPLYVGGNFVYHAGSETPRAYAYYPSAEIGYDIGVGDVLLRPYGGAGAMFRGGDVPSSSTGLVYPGFTVHWLVPRTAAFIGADGRVLFPFDSAPALAVMGTVGANL